MLGILGSLTLPRLPSVLASTGNAKILLAESNFEDIAKIQSTIYVFNINRKCAIWGMWALAFHFFWICEIRGKLRTETDPKKVTEGPKNCDWGIIKAKFEKIINNLFSKNKTQNFVNEYPHIKKVTEVSDIQCGLELCGSALPRALRNMYFLIFQKHCGTMFSLLSMEVLEVN